jgi:hypothetical protein
MTSVAQAARMRRHSLRIIKSEEQHSYREHRRAATQEVEISSPYVICCCASSLVRTTPIAHSMRSSARSKRCSWVTHTMCDVT